MCIRDRCGGRLVQRKDDAPETVKARLEVYHKAVSYTHLAKAYLRYVRIAPRKVQIVCDLIRGKDAGTAMAILMQTPMVRLL